MEDKGKAIDSAVEIYRAIDTTPVWFGLFGSIFAPRERDDVVLPIAAMPWHGVLLARQAIASTELETVRDAAHFDCYIFGICHVQPSDEWRKGFLVIAEYDGSTDSDSIYKAIEEIYEEEWSVLSVFVFKDGLLTPTLLLSNLKESAWAYPVYMTIL